MKQQPDYEPDFEDMNEINEIAGLAVSDLAKDIESAFKPSTDYSLEQNHIRDLMPLVAANPELWGKLSILWHEPRSVVLAFHEVLSLANQRSDPYEYFESLVKISLRTHSISFEFSLNDTEIPYRIEMASIVGIIYAAIFNSLKPKFKRINSSNEIHSLILQTIDNFGTEDKPKREDFVNPDLPKLEQDIMWKPIEDRYNARLRKLQPFKNAIKETMNKMIAFYG